MYTEYDSNNSGGGWWLSDEDWYALEKAGWVIEWATLSPRYDDDGGYDRDPETGLPKLVAREDNNSRYNFKHANDEGRWLGALATKAYRVGLGMRDAADEWERITGKSSTDAGCACCGQPHTFTEYDDNGKWVASGPDASYQASW